MRNRLELSARIFLETTYVEKKIAFYTQEVQEYKRKLQVSSVRLHEAMYPQEPPSLGGGEVNIRKGLVGSAESDLYLATSELDKFQRLANARRGARTKLGQTVRSVIWG